MQQIFYTIYQAITTPNEWLINLISIPFSIIEVILSMLLFTTILNIEATKKQQKIYVIIWSVFSIISSILIPKPYATYLNMILLPLTIFYIFKTSIIKSIIAELIPLIINSILETILLRLYLIFFNQPYDNIVEIPIYRISFLTVLYLISFLIYKIIKHFNINIKVLDKISSKNKRIIILNLVFALISIAVQFYLLVFYNEHLPLYIMILSTLTLFSYFIISFISLIKTTQLEITSENLEEEKLYNKSLKILHSNIKAFKHDFSNIVQSIGGYVETKDMEGLEKYYSELLEDCTRVNNLSTLSPDVINNPAIYSILASKYYKADELGIKINLGIYLDLNSLNMRIYEFTRILGILLDNAIEAASQCNDKIINVTIQKNTSKNMQLVIIQNTYSNKDIDVDKIYEKGYTSKTEDKNSHGLGLWEVRQILKRNNNLNLFTTKDDKFFTQQLEIYLNITKF